MMKRRRRYRNNPSTMTWLLLLGGGVGLYFLLRKAAAVGAYQTVCVFRPFGQPKMMRRVQNHASRADAQRALKACEKLADVFSSKLIEPGATQLPEGLQEFIAPTTESLEGFGNYEYD